jgi:hypothetical protein
LKKKGIKPGKKKVGLELTGLIEIRGEINDTEDEVTPTCL